jgi:methionyl-tRNA formyltransferase
MGRIAFFGTPDIAVRALEACIESAHDVVLVTAQPDRPKGRGQKLEPPPVKARALDARIPMLQPETLRKGTPDGDRFLDELRALDLDLAVVMAYGRIVPQRILDVPKSGFVNVHASLLPRWRGAAPIQRAILADDRETGVCLMKMVLALDEGDVLARASTPITDNDDALTLGARLSTLGHDLLVTHLDALVAGALPAVPQGDHGVTYASMLTKEEGRVDFTNSARALHCHARAMHPWPGAQTTLDGEVVKLFSPVLGPRGAFAPGVVVDASDALVVGTPDGAIGYREIQAPSKKRIAVRDFVRGHPIAKGTLLGP